MSERDTIPATCPRCGRPERSAPYEAADECQGTHTRTCADVAAAYARGIDEGVRLAKEHAVTVIPVRQPWGADGPCVYETARIDWTDVDKAAAVAKGER